MYSHRLILTDTNESRFNVMTTALLNSMGIIERFIISRSALLFLLSSICHSILYMLFATPVLCK